MNAKWRDEFWRPFLVAFWVTILCLLIVGGVLCFGTPRQAASAVGAFGLWQIATGKGRKDTMSGILLVMMAAAWLLSMHPST